MTVKDLDFNIIDAHSHLSIFDRQINSLIVA